MRPTSLDSPTSMAEPCQRTDFALQQDSSSVPPTEKGSQTGVTLATISVVLGLISIFVAGIPLGIAAVAVGAYAWLKGQKLAMIGIVIGIIGFVTAVLLLSLS